MIDDVLAAAENAASVVVNTPFDWHEITLGLLVLLIPLIGWIFSSTINWLQRVNEKVDQHIKEDNDHFAAVLKNMNDNHIEILKILPKRHDD